jgi:hypothetical protein
MFGCGSPEGAVPSRRLQPAAVPAAAMSRFRVLVNTDSGCAARAALGTIGTLGGTRRAPKGDARAVTMASVVVGAMGVPSSPERPPACLFGSRDER